MVSMGQKRKLLAATAITTAAIAGIHIINRVVFCCATMKEKLKQSSEVFYEWRFGKIYYTKEGQGKPLLLIHRLNYAASGYEWNTLKKELAKNHTVYTLDLLGCGRSEKPKITYTNYLYVQLINDFVKEVIKGKTDVITSGDSSVIASMACLVEPGLYHRLVFLQPEKISVTGKIPKANHKALKYVMEAPVIGTTIYNIISSKNMLKRRCREYWFGSSYTDISEAVETMSEAAHLSGSSSRYLYASARSHYTDIYVGNAIRMLDHSIFIVASDSPESQEMIKEYTEINPAVESQIIPDVGLLMQMEKPEDVLELCSLFLA